MGRRHDGRLRRREGRALTGRSTAGDLDLRDLLRPGDTVLFGQGAGEPQTLVAALMEQQDRIAPVTVVLGTVLSDRWRPESVGRGMDVKGFIGAGRAGALIDAGVLDVVPCSVSDIPRLLRARCLRVDAVFVQVSPADAHGDHSLGLVADYLREAIEVARVAVAEVNPRVPFTLGDTRVPASRFAATVDSDLPPLEVPTAPRRRMDESLARHAAALIPDGATLQVGIGQTADAILDALWDKTDLGVHSGMITDRVAELMAAGVITNRRKPIDTQVTVTGTLFGTEAGLYRFAHRNPAIAMRPVSYTHDPRIIAQLDRFVAVNSAVEVDLTGQINTEAAGSRHVGAIGGQLDFARAALMAPEGRSIVALASTTGDGARSRIVRRLGAAPVSIPRSCADVVVTELGVADLRGRSSRERAELLVAIADPRFRAELIDGLRARR